MPRAFVARERVRPQGGRGLPALPPPGRGFVREGYWADLVLFDPETVRDMATYKEPPQEPVGIELVVVNGEIAYEGGKHTGVGAGRMLRYRQDG